MHELNKEVKCCCKDTVFYSVSQMKQRFIYKKNNLWSQRLIPSCLQLMLKDKRGNKGLRAIAQEIGGVSFATLSRIEQGKIPDVDTFVKICKWLGVSTDTFIIGGEN